MNQSALSGQPIRLDVGSAAGGAVIFTPAAQPASAIPNPPVTQSTEGSSALDGMKSTAADHETNLAEQDSPPRPLSAAQQESEA